MPLIPNLHRQEVGAQPLRRARFPKPASPSKDRTRWPPANTLCSLRRRLHNACPVGFARWQWASDCSVFPESPFPSKCLICSCWVLLHHPMLCVCPLVDRSLSYKEPHAFLVDLRWWDTNGLQKESQESNLVPRETILKPCFHLDISNTSMVFAFYTKYLAIFVLKIKAVK